MPTTLGAFSISLAVKDLAVSREFYAKLGFEVFAGSAEQHYLILKNGNAIIGIFEGMFDKNILTFNPGWDENAQKVDTFTDVHELQRRFADLAPSPAGPKSFLLIDPDGNQILLDQHV